jgi:hypothetical protein
MQKHPLQSQYQDVSEILTIYCTESNYWRNQKEIWYSRIFKTVWKKRDAFQTDGGKESTDCRTGITAK